MAGQKCLLFVSANGTKLADLRLAMRNDYECVLISLEKFTHGSVLAVDGILIDIDLKNSNAVELVHRGLSHVDRNKTFLLAVVTSGRQTDLSEAHELGVDDYIKRSGPEGDAKSAIESQFYAETSGNDFIKSAQQKIERLCQNYAVRKNQPKAMQLAIKAGDDAMSAVFESARTGVAPDKLKLQEDTAAIIDALYEHGLDTWLNMVRNHHDATYQHCLIVTGVATAFGQAIGCNTKDLERLAVGAMLHDIGKAMIPLHILEKQGPLDAEEWVVMRKHPSIGRTIFADMQGYDPEVVDIIAHHHEYLDGSGYPDGLSGSEITDIVRVMTISDIFGAMMEKRSYKPAMSPLAAYDVISSMNNRLEMPLVKAFKKIVTTFPTAA